MENYLPPREDELKANDAATLFDNVTDCNGRRLSQSEKRARLLELMKSLSLNTEKNICKLYLTLCLLCL